MSFSISDLYAEGTSTCCDASVYENDERCTACGEHCGIVTPESYRQECIEIDEHMKRTYPEDGYDKCFNCGSEV